jgi:hypothetical protein
MSVMEQFPRNFRTNLRFSNRTLIAAAVAIAALFAVLMAAYNAFDLGAVLPKRRP